MGKFIDMTSWVMSEHGVPDSRLIVIERAEDYINTNGHRVVRWKCKCLCGSQTDVIASSYDITSGHIKSCGCLRKELASRRVTERCKKYNQYNLNNQYGVGLTFNTKQEFYFDLEDYDLIKNYCWSENEDGYLCARGKNGKILKMHRLVLDFPNEMDIDHINHDLLDNRKSNLRICEHFKNMMNQSKRSDNTSGIPGVNFHTQNNTWVARIGVNGKRIYLGEYSNIIDAITARRNAEEKYFGEFSYDNSVKENDNNV